MKIGNFNIERRNPRGFIMFAKKHFGKKKLNGVEIGTFKGENALYLLKNLGFKKLYLVDSYDTYSEYNKEFLQECRSIAERRLSDRPINYPYKFIINTSDNFFKLLKNSEDKSFDFIYIDGDHSYEQCKRDIMNAYPLVKKGGLLGGHDFNQVGVSRAVWDFCLLTGCDVQTGKGNDWWIIK